jgi:NAD(P)-dependent dehydrogenase (short-subunit alcohol dehydrogenase family)
MSDPRFVGKRAFVTGAGSGIGRAAARRLAAEGAAVVGFDIAAAGLQETFAGIPRTRYEVVDVAGSEAPEALLDAGPADVLVNAAGVLFRHDALAHPLEDWNRTLEVNLKAPFRLSREFARDNLRRGSAAAIVNVCSVESFVAIPGHAAYTASKSGLLMLTRAFALELAPHRIRVNGVAPGVTATGMNAAARADRRAAARLASAIPAGRFADPPEQAAGICFLASEEASYVTGAVLAIDGGWLTR